MNEFVYIVFKGPDYKEFNNVTVFFTKQDIVDFAKQRNFVWDKEQQVFLNNAECLWMRVESVVPKNWYKGKRRVDCTKEWEDSLKSKTTDETVHDFFAVEQKLFEEVTEGPWRVSDSHGLCVGNSEGMITDFSPEAYDPPWRGKREDATFIARARTGWPLALKVLSKILILCKESEENEVWKINTTELKTLIETSYARCLEVED